MGTFPCYPDNGTGYHPDNGTGYHPDNGTGYYPGKASGKSRWIHPSALA